MRASTGHFHSGVDLKCIPADSGGQRTQAFGQTASTKELNDSYISFETLCHPENVPQKTTGSEEILPF